MEAHKISALTLYETRLAARAKGGEAALADLDELLTEIQPDIVPFDAMRMRAVEAAYARYGKGIHAAARLNLVDCAAYALAIELGVPLLIKGNDSAATDVSITPMQSPGTEFQQDRRFSKSWLTHPNWTNPAALTPLRASTSLNKSHCAFTDPQSAQLLCVL